MQRLAMDQLTKAVEEDNLGGYKSLAEELLEQYDSTALISAALKLLSKTNREIPVTLTEENPIRVRRPASAGGRGRSRSGGPPRAGHTGMRSSHPQMGDMRRYRQRHPGKPTP